MLSSKFAPFIYFLGAAFAQMPEFTFAEYFNITTFPNQQSENASRLLIEGREAAGSDAWPHFLHRCIRLQAFPEIASGLGILGFVESFSPFKNVFFVGQSAWSAWAIDTGNRELVLIDALASPDEVEQILLPGLQAHGYSGSDIKHVFITHEHWDHFGGLAYLQEHFNPYVYANEAAWKTMTVAEDFPPQYYNYSKAVNVKDSDQFVFNDFNITAYHTPGHTPGTISFQFPVQDYDPAGTWHLAGLVGGGGVPASATAKAEHANSFLRLAKLATENGVDVMISNHQTQDDSLTNFDILRYRKCDATACNVDNPFVVGLPMYERYLKSLSYCPLLLAARRGQIVPGNVTNLDGFYKRSIEDEVDIYSCSG